jgi:hypothetical protein
MVHAKGSTPHSSLCCLVSGGSARDECHGWLLFTAYAFWEPDEEVTPEDIVTIKLLVAAWPESANIPHLDDSDDSDDPDDPDE